MSAGDLIIDGNVATFYVPTGYEVMMAALSDSSNYGQIQCVGVGGPWTFNGTGQPARLLLSNGDGEINIGPQESYTKFVATFLYSTSNQPGSFTAVANLSVVSPSGPVDDGYQWLLAAVDENFTGEYDVQAAIAIEQGLGDAVRKERISKILRKDIRKEQSTSA